MFANERYDIILGLLKTQRSVTVSQLCEEFGVSIETVRRDLAHLEKLNKLMRVHGGAIALSDKNSEFAVLSTRLGENIERKQELSEHACSYVNEGDIIFIDSGSTAAELAHTLCSKFNRLTVVTHSTDVVNIITEHSDFELVCTGGTYMSSERLFYGCFAEETLWRLHIDKCFVAPSALSLKFGATVSFAEAFSIERIAIKMSDKTYLIADSSKFEINAPMRICELDAADAVITDSTLDDNIYRLYRDNGIKIIKG